MRTLVVGSRGSQLALRQTRWVADRLSAAHDGLSVEVKVIKTTGDHISTLSHPELHAEPVEARRTKSAPLAGISDRGLFVKEIELALLAGEIDFAVHSAKDLPSEMDERLTVAAFPERECPADALVSRAGPFDGLRVTELPEGARVGTSSVRRRAQLLGYRPDLDVIDLRGNLDTRLGKLDNGDYDAIILAAAGLARMGLSDRATELIPSEIMLPAIGQGALAVQCQQGDDVCALLACLDHAETRACVTAERAFSEGVHAGCQTPVAALASIGAGTIEIDALVASLDGSTVIRHSDTGDASEPVVLGRRVAEWFLDSPARGLLEEARLGSGPAAMGAA